MRLLALSLVLATGPCLSQAPAPLRIFSSDEAIPKQCRAIYRVEHTLTAKRGMPDYSLPIGVLEDRVMEKVKDKTRGLGGDALQITEASLGDFKDGFEIHRAGMAYTCRVRNS